MSNPNMEATIHELMELKRLKEELEAEIAAIEDILKAAMGEQEEMLCGEYKLTYQTVSTSRFDSTRFKKEHADLAAAYTKSTTYRRFSVR